VEPYEPNRKTLDPNPSAAIAAKGLKTAECVVFLARPDDPLKSRFAAPLKKASPNRHEFARRKHVTDVRSRDGKRLGLLDKNSHACPRASPTRVHAPAWGCLLRRSASLPPDRRRHSDLSLASPIPVYRQLPRTFARKQGAVSAPCSTGLGLLPQRCPFWLEPTRIARLFRSQAGADDAERQRRHSHAERRNEIMCIDPHTRMCRQKCDSFVRRKQMRIDLPRDVTTLLRLGKNPQACPRFGPTRSHDPAWECRRRGSASLLATAGGTRPLVSPNSVRGQQPRTFGKESSRFVSAVRRH
jgi:hypothetical protein